MRMVRGIEVSDESLSVDVIKQVCRGGSESGGHFLGTEQSLALMNSEYYYPHTGDRQRRDDWEADGGQDMWERAREKARQILQSHQAEPLPAEIDAAIRRRFDILLPPELAGQGKV